MVRFFFSFGKKRNAERIAKDPKKARGKSREREGKRKKAGGQGAGAGGRRKEHRAESIGKRGTHSAWRRAHGEGRNYWIYVPEANSSAKGVVSTPPSRKQAEN